MGLFEGGQLPHERVELGVADLGFVELVVAPAVVLDLGSQLLGSFRGIVGQDHQHPRLAIRV